MRVKRLEDVWEAINDGKLNVFIDSTYGYCKITYVDPSTWTIECHPERSPQTTKRLICSPKTVVFVLEVQTGGILV